MKKKIDDMQKAPQQVMKNLTSEAKKRVPGWVATEVAKQYGVKKGEITGQKIGRIKAEGDSFKEVRVVYTGRVLTPTHFNMSPKAPNPGGGYTLKATIVKGQRTTLGQVKKLTKKQVKLSMYISMKTAMVHLIWLHLTTSISLRVNLNNNKLQLNNLFAILALFQQKLV